MKKEVIETITKNPIRFCIESRGNGYQLKIRHNWPFYLDMDDIIELHKLLGEVIEEEGGAL
ncbi:hypothetical protein FACS189451_08780 [Bacteroidia bacterium]|nr:hypothetical protein FACS189451_08780 [Bacteroidia bacterium]